MKRIRINVLSMIVLLGSQIHAYAEEPPTIFLVPTEELSNFGNPSDEPPTESIPTRSSSAETPKNKKKNLDELIAETQAVPLTDKQKRVVAMIERDQREFIKMLDQFLVVSFDENDDKASTEFNQVRDRIVELVMRSHTERAYYERLYLINAQWLAHPKEVLRFASLDRYLLNRWQSMDESRRRMQSIVIAGAAVVGAGVGGYVTFKMTSKTFAVAATDGILAKLAKWSGRVSFTIAGVYVGSMLGRYAGFLGSEYVFGNNRDYLDPIDGTEDLKDLLDEIDPIP